MARPVEQARPEVSHLGPYEIVRKLARGGMAELFLARTTGAEGIPKLVVLKKILPSHAENPKFVRLFLDEAKLASTLVHPHIAQVFDMGKADGHYFFTMEHVHGQDVRTTMRRLARFERQFAIQHAVQIARDVASALHYAHERRRDDGTLLDIVHRDVSPSNILVSYEGNVKLVDFGVAKAATSTVKTRTGALKGKIAYMSPEQAKGAPIDRRSDIFSLGIVLWEMLTGHRLFKAENDLATIQRIINSNAQPPSHLRPECSPELDRIVLRALAYDLDQRYQTAEQFQLDLEALALGQSPIELRAYMQELFDEELRAWSAAQAAGQTLTEFIVEKATCMTTPVSESDIYSLDELDDGDLDEEEGAETLAPTAPTAPPAPAAPPTLKMELPPQPVQPSPLLDASDAPTEIATMPPVVIEPELARRTGTTPFPIAPPEWRQMQASSTAEADVATLRTKRILIGSSIAFGVIVLLVALLAGDPPAPPAEPAAPTTIEMQATPTKIEMKAVPTSDLAAEPQ